jgi:hypothetical protein
VFEIAEIAEHPDKAGKCLRMVTDKKAQSWAPEWMPYTIIGDRNWNDYEVRITKPRPGNGGAHPWVENVIVWFGEVELSGGPVIS